LDDLGGLEESGVVVERGRARRRRRRRRKEVRVDKRERRF
jgi:hypothetical protein